MTCPGLQLNMEGFHGFEIEGPRGPRQVNLVMTRIASDREALRRLRHGIRV